MIRVSAVTNGAVDFALTNFQFLDITGTNSDDQFYASASGGNRFVGLGGSDIFYGSDAADTLDGGAGDDYVLGLGGDDSIIFGEGVDTIAGGEGNDRLLAQFDRAVLVLAVAGSDPSAVSTGLVSEVETISADGHADVRLRGSSVRDVIDLRPVNLIGIAAIEGGEGDDTITGSLGLDSIAAGGGNDLIYLTNADDTIDGGLGQDEIRAAADDTVLSWTRQSGPFSNGLVSGVEKVSAHGHANFRIVGLEVADVMDFTGVVLAQVTAIEGKGGKDTIFGSIDADRIDGGLDDDVLSGAGGDDTVIGGGGNDTATGGIGSDSIDGGAGADVAGYATNRGLASIVRNPDSSLTVSTTLDGADTLRHVEQVKFADGLFSFTFAAAGSPVVANFNPAFGWASQDQCPRHVADVNGDGYLDIVGFGIAGVLVSFGSANGSFTGAALQLADYGQNSGWATDNGFHRELADVNGDGRADILGFGFAGTLVSLAKADGTFAPVSTGIADFGVNQGWANQNGFARTVGDVNGDGKADIVGFGFAGALVALGNGDGTFRSVKTAISNFGVNQGWTSDNTFHRAVADVNGDGKADIVGFGIAGTLVALSKGDGTFADAQLVLQDFGTNQGWASNDSFSRLVVDVNGDHIADIVGFGTAGTLVAFGKGDGTFTQASLDVGDFGRIQGWSSDNTFHREVADVNKDGLADIVGFGIAGVLIGTNQGDFLV